MKSIVLSTVFSWLSRLCAIILNLVGIPLALAKLGPSRFGLLLVVLSIGSWIGFANIGTGRLIANVVARRRKAASRFTIEMISFATVLAAAFNLLLFVAATTLFILAMHFITANEAIAANYHEFFISVVTLFFAMALWFFLSIFEGIDAGHHQLHRLYIFQVCSYLVSLTVLLLLFPARPSIWLAAALLNLGFLLGSLAHAADVVRRNSHLFSLNFVWSRRIARLLLLSSIDFTIINLGLGVMFQLAPGLFGFVYGPESVLELGIFIRLMQSYGALVISFTYPLSNVLASRLKARENESALHTGRISLLLLIAGGGLAGCIFFATGDVVLSFWLRTSVELDRFFRLGASLLITITALHLLFSALLVAASEIRRAAYIHLGEAVAYPPLAYIFFWLYGQSGILLAMDLVFGAGVLVMVTKLRGHAVLSQLFRVSRSPESLAQ
jgi:O-antigen/teichoic acid export membrane protein